MTTPDSLLPEQQRAVISTRDKYSSHVSNPHIIPISTNLKPHLQPPTKRTLRHLLPSHQLTPTDTTLLPTRLHLRSRGAQIIERDIQAPNALRHSQTPTLKRQLLRVEVVLTAPRAQHRVGAEVGGGLLLGVEDGEGFGAAWLAGVGGFAGVCGAFAALAGAVLGDDVFVGREGWVVAVDVLFFFFGLLCLLLMSGDGLRGGCRGLCG